MKLSLTRREARQLGRLLVNHVNFEAMPEAESIFCKICEGFKRRDGDTGSFEELKAFDGQFLEAL